MSLHNVKYVPHFLSQEDCSVLTTFLSKATWQQEQFRIFGKVIPAPRLTTWYGDPGVNYVYTGIDHSGEGWPSVLNPIRTAVSAVANEPYNFVLVNRYDHGAHHVGWHRDDESMLSGNVASLSLGASRRFRMREGKQTRSWELAAGSLLVFDGAIEHCLPKTRKAVGERFNLSFRIITATAG